MIGLGVIAAARTVAGGGGSTDPLWADVLLLLHGDGSAGGTTIADSSAAARTATVSGVTTETSVAGYFGSAQLRIENGEYVRWPGLRLTAAGTYTIEGFLTPYAFNSPRSHLFGCWTPETGWTLDLDSGGTLGDLAVNGVLASTSGSGASLTTGMRYHVALVITLASGATTGTLYVNGTSVRTFTAGVVGSLGSTSDSYMFRLGNRSDSTLNQNASWDEVRVTQGARYAANFTPPTAPYPDMGEPTSARYWRITAIQVTGGYFEMTEMQMLNGTTNLNSSATVTSSSAPSFATLADVVDGSLSTRAYWTDTVAEDSAFFIQWDFGAGTAVDGFRMAGENEASRYPTGLTIQSSPDGSAWTTERVITGATFPGGSTMSSTFSIP